MPTEKELKSNALSCSMFAQCQERPFSFCLKKWIEYKDNLMFRKVTYKDCWECKKDSKN